MIVMILGLSSRKLSFVIPDFLDLYLGDVLWALMIFFMIAFFLPTIKTKLVAIIAVLFCFFIEGSQLYHAEWIDKIRHTTLGGLVLGYGFLWSDLVSYVIGIGIGVIIEFVRGKIRDKDI